MVSKGCNCSSIWDSIAGLMYEVMSPQNCNFILKNEILHIFSFDCLLLCKMCLNPKTKIYYIAAYQSLDVKAAFVLFFFRYFQQAQKIPVTVQRNAAPQLISVSLTQSTNIYFLCTSPIDPSWNGYEYVQPVWKPWLPS